MSLDFNIHSALEKEIATHSSVLAWRISGTGSLVGCCLWVAQSRTRLKRLSSSSSSRVLDGPKDTKGWPHLISSGPLTSLNCMFLQSLLFPILWCIHFLSPLSFRQSSGSQPGSLLPPGDGICDGHVIRKRATSIVKALSHPAAQKQSPQRKKYPS